MMKKISSRTRRIARLIAETFPGTMVWSERDKVWKRIKIKNEHPSKRTEDTSEGNKDP